MIAYIQGMQKSILYFFLALLLADFLIFVRGWSMGDMKAKYILLFLLKFDAGIILSALFFLFLLNIPEIVEFFMK